VESQLQPILDYLNSLGLDAQHAARMACVYPELLLSSVQEQLQPLVHYLQGLGCGDAQVARLLQVRQWVEVEGMICETCHHNSAGVAVVGL
jgi:hypothetical protein